jgi:uncharacterized phage-associated protein
MTTLQLGPAVTTAASVANEFLTLAEQEQSAVPPVDQMKLQKLLFYAHAWFLGGKNQPLFEEDFEACPWGPVVRDVYSQTVKFGRSPVKGRIVEIQNSGFFAPEGVDGSDLKAFIKEIWDVHKTQSYTLLHNLSTQGGESAMSEGWLNLFSLFAWRA